MSQFMPVTVRGDSNVQLRGIAATLRSMPTQVTPRLVPLVCMPINSSRAFEDLVHVSAVPKVRKWTDERAGGSIATLKQTITNDTYEVSMSINGDDYDDDQIGAYSPVLQELMQSLLLAPDELVTTNLIVGGNSNAGYDGVNFYSTTHKWPGGEFQTNQSNNQTATGQDAASLENDFWTAKNAMVGWKDDRGRLRMPPIDFQGSEAFVVHHSIALSQSMQRVFGLTRGGDAFELQPLTDQTKFPRKSSLAGAAIVVPDGYLTGNTWYVHSVRGLYRPFAFLDRLPPYVTIFGPGSEHYEKYNEVLFLGKRRFGLGYLKPERSQRIA